MDFDIGEAYAGQMSISDDLDGPDKFYFWFQPSPNPAAKKEIVIWLNGGVSPSPHILLQAVACIANSIFTHSLAAHPSRASCRKTARSCGSTAHTSPCPTRGDGTISPTCSGSSSPSTRASRPATSRPKTKRTSRGSSWASSRTSSTPFPCKGTRCTSPVNHTRSSPRHTAPRIL